MSVFLFLLAIHTVQGVILLLDQDKTVNVTLGEPYSFYCSGWRGGKEGHIFLIRNHVLMLFVNGCSSARSRIDQYNLQCESRYSAFYLLVEIPAENMTEDEHNSLWECPNGGEPFIFGHVPTKRLTLHVLAPIEEVLIETPTHNLTSIKESSMLTCSARNSRPAASLNWYIDGEKVQNESLIKYTVSGNDKNRYTAVSKLTLLGNLTKRYQTIYCEGHNIPEKSPVRSENVTVEVLYNPGESPTIQGYTSGFRLLTTDPPLTLTCRIRKSWPRPSLQWVCPKLSDIQPLTYTTEHVFGKITIDVSTELDGQTCACIATQSVNNFNRRTSVKFVVIAKSNAHTSSTSSASSSKTTRKGEIMFAVGVTFLVITTVVLVILIVRRKFRCKMERKDLSDSRDSSKKARHGSEHPMSTIADNIGSDYETIDQIHRRGDFDGYQRQGTE